MRRTRDAGLYEKYLRREDLIKLKIKLSTEEKIDKIAKSFINLGSGMYTIFGISGVLMIFSLIIFGFEFFYYNYFNII